MDQHHEIWKELARKALVGTEREGGGDLPPGGPLQELFDSLPSEPPQSRLLSMAAAVSFYERAGWMPPLMAEPSFEICPDDDAPVCSPQAGQLLASILTGRFPEALHEWLAAAVSRSQRVPEDLIPSVLDAGRRDRSLRAPILAVVGRRGPWLAALNSEWNWAAAGDPEAEWETASRDVREALVLEMRRQDPAHAREMILSTWKQDSADERTAFVSALREGLSMEDESFLETALEDRSKEVRSTAADLLARLPDSRLGARMVERLHPLLHFERKAGILGIKKTCDMKSLE